MPKNDSLPQSDILAEKTILGSILLDNDIFFDDIGELAADDFYLDSHQKIFRCMNEILYGMVDRVLRVDLLTVGSVLRERSQLENIGGMAYLADLTNGMPRHKNVEDHVKIVRDKAKLRKLMRLGQDLYSGASSPAAVADALTERAQDSLSEIIAEEAGTKATHVSEFMYAVEEEILAKRNVGMDRIYLDLTWGIDILDAKTKGAFGGELTVIGGESGGGKTQAVAQMVLANAQNGVPCGVMSMEMKKELFMRRLYSLMAKDIFASHIRDPRAMNLHVHVAELKRITALISKLPIWVDDSSGLSGRKLVARMRTMIHKHEVRLIGVDYLQLIQYPGKTGVEKVEAVQFMLRDFIKGRPQQHLVVLSQYAKEGTSGFSKKKRRRTKDDLYGGAVVHQAAQNVFLINIDDPNKSEGDTVDAEIDIQKQREGPTMRVPVAQNKNSLRFETRPEVPEGEKKSERKSAANKPGTVDGKDRAAGSSG